MKCTCPVCGKKIYLKGTREEIKKPYICPECGNAFAETDDGKYLIGIESYVKSFFKSVSISLTTEQALKCYFA